MTGQPTARAPAVSVPTTDIAKGKLQAPITATGPIGTFCLNIAGLETESLLMSSASDE